MVAENAGISLVNMALAFMLAHPAVTAPIIGPRTMEQLQSQLDAVDVTRGTDVQTRSAKSFHPASPSHARTTATCRQRYKTPSCAGAKRVPRPDSDKAHKSASRESRRAPTHGQR